MGRPQRRRRWEEALVSRWRSLSVEEKEERAASGRRMTEEAFGAVLEARRVREVSRHSSYAVIPRLWGAKQGLAAALTSAAEVRCEQRASLLSWEELERLRQRLREAESEPRDGSRRVNYEGVRRAALELAAPGFATELSARRFLSLPRDRHGRVSARELYNEVDRATCAARTRRALRPYARGKTYVREHELERYIYDLLPDMPAAQSMDEKFHAFYVFTASRRFMFFLDAKRRGRVSLEALAASPLSLELHEMADLPALAAEHKHNDHKLPAATTLARKPSTLPATYPRPPGGNAPPPLPALSTSWFFPDNAKRVYSDYLELDVDHNGMLSKREFLNFRGPRGETRLTDAFADRVFEELITYRTENPPASGRFDSEMDFKTYLDVVLAFENLDSAQALSYFWRILDLHKRGYLDTFVINFFFRDVAKRLENDGFDPPNAADVVDEIFDMVKPAKPLRLTLPDLLRCGVAHTVILMLVDVAGFLAYDNREHLIHAPDDDDDF